MAMVSLESLSKMGIGTWGVAGYLHADPLVDTDKQLDALKAAFGAGANYIDCSLKYADGASLRVIKELIEYAGRDNIFISAKLEQYVETPDSVREQLEVYLRALDIDFVDVLQLHAPSFTKIGITNTYQEIRKLIDAKLARYAGASNFSIAQLEQAIVASKGHFALHESLFNVSFRQNEDAGILDFSKQHGIKFIAYQPLHRGKTEASGNELILELARTYAKTPSQIMLNWLIHKDILPLIRSDNPVHIKENLSAAAFVMDPSDYARIDMYRDPIANDMPVDWTDSGSGNAIYQVANQ